MGKNKIIKWIASTILVCLAGCKSPASGNPKQGMVLILPGIEHWSMPYHNVSPALRQRGFNGRIELYRWGSQINWMGNLMYEKKNHQAAEKLAKKIIDYKQKYPDKPIYIIAYSGGAGLTILMLEKLPDEVKVEQAILVHCAIASDYNLVKALDSINNCIVNIYSPADWLLLGAGTTVCGTIDRQYQPSAGMQGFDEEKAIPDVTRRNKLKQNRWQWDHIKQGRWGGHSMIYAEKFSQDFVVKEIEL